MDASSQSSGNNQFAHDTVAQVKEKCLEQRKKAIATKDSDPCDACVELFHRAFKGDEEAWEAMHKTYYPFMHKIVSAFTTQKKLKDDFPVNFGEPDDIINSVLYNFLARAKREPEFITSTHIKGIEGLIKTSLTRYMLGIMRELGTGGRGNFPRPIPLDDPDKPEPPDHSDRFEEVLQREYIGQWTKRHLKDDKERLIFELAFQQLLTPAQIVKWYGEDFLDTNEVNKIKERLIERLKKDSELWKLLGEYSGSSVSGKSGPNASFIVGLSNSQDAIYIQEGKDVNIPCHLSEAVLLDYITGVASLDVIAVVEKSPACKQAAQQLADEMMPLLRKLYRISCPEPSKLLDYYEHKISSTEFLVMKKHVTDCARCQADLVRIEAAFQVPLDDEPGVIESIKIKLPELFRKFVEAVAVIPMSPVVRGDSNSEGKSAMTGDGSHRYETPQLIIELASNALKIPGRPPTWILSGELYTHEGQPYTEAERVILRPLEIADPVEYQATLDDSTFVCEGLEEGDYNIRVLTEDQKIVIRKYSIGGGR